MVAEREGEAHHLHVENGAEVAHVGSGGGESLIPEYGEEKPRTTTTAATATTTSGPADTTDTAEDTSSVSTETTAVPQT